MRKKLFLSVLALGLLFLVCSIWPKYVYYIVGSGNPSSHSLQEQKYWCGEACLEMYACFKFPADPFKCRSQSEIATLADTQRPYEGLLNPE